jgi:hypothetical protein
MNWTSLMWRLVAVVARAVVEVFADALLAKAASREQAA